MTYTIDASDADRIRILFTDPHEFEVDLRYLKVHDTDPQEYIFAVSTHFSKDQSNALVEFTKGLTPEQLAAFAAGVATTMLGLAAELEG